MPLYVRDERVREQLYKSLSENGNPTLETTLAVMKAIGFEITSRRQGA